MVTAERNFAPGPRGSRWFGMLRDIRRDRLGFVRAMRAEYGDIVRFTMGRRILHLISGPAEIRHVLVDRASNYTKGVGLSEARRWLGDGLVTSEGPVWARQRRAMQPAFHRQRIGDFASVVIDCAEAMLRRWEPIAREGRALIVSDDLMALTLEVIARTMFSTAITERAEIREAFTAALADAMTRMTEIFPVPAWIPTPSNLRFRRAIVTLSRVIDDIVARHLSRDSEASHDLLSALLARGEGGEPGLSPREVRDQVMTILLAGHETTATSIGWTLYLLHCHPEAGAQLRMEVKRVVGSRTPMVTDLAALTWTRCVYEESLRLYPPVWLIPRRAVAADKLGGFEIPPGSDVLVSPWVLHRHPEHWDRPEEFRPERFLAGPSHGGAAGTYVYLPFGAGPRACIGSAFATTEAMLVLAMIAQRWRLELVRERPVIPDPSLTLRFRAGLHMTPVAT